LPTLVGAVRKAKTDAKEHSDQKNVGKAARPLVRGSTVDPIAGLALWHKEVRDTEAYPGYVPVVSKKMIGQMQHWLRELVGQDMTEEQIRTMIQSYVRKWVHVPDRKRREIRCVSASGKPYTFMMSYTPNFDVFFAHRTVIIPILEETSEPGKFADGTERGFIKYY
jgi:hypothetical protein